METPQPAAAPKKKLLLVEDEANIASMVQDWLAEKYQVVHAADGKTAVQMAADEKPDLILEDINLPDMLGFDVVRLMQKNPKSAGIPIIFLTGQKMVEETIKFISTEKAVKGFVNKPFKLKEFLEKIELVLGGSNFVLMEKAPTVTPETFQRAQMVRTAQKVAAEAENPPPPAAAPAPAPSVKVKKRGLFGALVSALFRMLLWLFLAALAAAAGGELCCRLVKGMAGGWSFFPALSASPSPAAAGFLAPGASWEENGVTYRLNALGLRDGEPPAPSTDTFNVLVLGGTALFGRDVPAGALFSARLEALLNGSDLFAPPGRHRVMNAALWGLPPAEQWGVGERLAERYKPGLIVWALGDGPTRRPRLDRLQKARAWPAWVADARARSALASLAAMTYLYGPSEPPVPPAADAAAVDRFLEKSTGTFMVVLKLEKEDRLGAGPGRANLLTFSVEKTPGLDLSAKGLTAGGHETLSRTTFAVLKQYRDRLKTPTAASPPPPAEEKPASLRPAARPRTALPRRRR
jgi:CheY-like chemotaxis protein